MQLRQNVSSKNFATLFKQSFKLILLLTVKKEISTLDKSDDYWKELSEFRKENKIDCISSKGNC